MIIDASPSVPSARTQSAQGNAADLVLHCETLIHALSPSLESALALGLLVDVSEPSLLLALLEQTCSGEEEGRINTSHTKCGRENIIDKDVGETGNGSGTASHQGSSSGRSAGCVRDEGGRSAVEVPAACEL